MSSVDSDTLKIPIEIKTDDLNEIRKLIEDITNAENDVKTLKPRRGKDDSSRSAFGNRESAFATDDRGGIFGGQQGSALPTQGRDKDSRTPVQKESEFAKLKNQVQEQESRGNMAGQAIQGGLGQAAQGLGFAQFLGGAKATGVISKIAGLASKSFLPLAIITTITGIISSSLDAMLAPSGKFDRRFRRNFGKESLRLSSLKEKAEITFGRRIVRITTIGNQRGTDSQVRSNLDYVKNGVNIFDVNGVFNKGIGAGII